jgi:hypothetical protein
LFFSCGQQSYPCFYYNNVNSHHQVNLIDQLLHSSD